MLKTICLEDYGTRVGNPVPLVGHCIVIASDYEGYGLTKDRAHPYMVQNLTARQVADAVTYHRMATQAPHCFPPFKG